MAASTAPSFFSRQHRLGLLYQRGVHCWVIFLAFSTSFDRRLGRLLATDGNQSVVLPAALLQTASRSRFCPTTVSVSCSQLCSFALTTHSTQTRSFAWSGTDRPFRPICSSPSADSQLAAFDFHTNNPATNTLICRLVQLRNQFVAGVPTGRSLARRPPAAAGMAARLSDNL